MGVEPANPEAVDSAEWSLVPDVEAVVQGTCSENNRRVKDGGLEGARGNGRSEKRNNERTRSNHDRVFDREKRRVACGSAFDDKI